MSDYFDNFRQAVQDAKKTWTHVQIACDEVLNVLNHELGYNSIKKRRGKEDNFYIS